jgi:hypothetical protein
MVGVLLIIWIMKQIVQQMADEQGKVTVQNSEAVKPEIDLDINIRSEDLTIFESENGELFIKTDEMPSDVYAEVIPTSNGPVAELVVGVDMELSECNPAERKEQPDVDTKLDSTVIVD